MPPQGRPARSRSPCPLHHLSSWYIASRKKKGKKTGARSRAGCTLTLPVSAAADYTSNYAYLTGKAFGTLVATLDGAAELLASGDAALRPASDSTFFKSAFAGTIALPFLVRLDGQDEPTQLAWFEIEVDAQSGEVSTAVRFVITGKTAIFYDLASDMTCFPPVPYVKPPGTPNPPNHPTFHEWIVSTFGGAPDFVKSDYFTPEYFIYYMQYMSYYYVI